MIFCLNKENMILQAKDTLLIFLAGLLTGMLLFFCGYILILYETPIP